MEFRSGWLLNLTGRLTPYREAWELQKALVVARQQELVPDSLILLVHPPVITIGRSGKREHLLIPPDILKARGFEVYEIERGGSATYHGPGQLVGYPILHLRAYNEDIVRYMRNLEETIIRTIADFQIRGERIRGYPGVWVDGAKIAAVGVAVKRKVTMHGFALNVDPDLSHFQVINPCGLGKPVTSMAAVLGHPVALEEVAESYTRHFMATYHLVLTPVSFEGMQRQLEELYGTALHPSEWSLNR
ncbi:MAG: lipoyl(octanoyl) transferase LipB [Armatimonadota bacterium]|nr:lipoyl(octanoyl) transferase LipB [Armatimonadota bacterium]